MGAAQELLSEPGEEHLPRKFDRYDLLKKLATGGMAEIYLAKQSGLEGFEKVVVLKRILSHLAQDEEFVSMFLDEARIAAKLSHPNIVQIYDLGKADGSYYIAMEYVSGRNVQHIINKQQDRGEPVPVEHVCRVIAGVCDGLHYAHSRKDYDGSPLNIVHRDISPQNILVSFAGGVKVVDFGIAKATTQIAQTRAGVLKGKYAYMSPEQVRGWKIDARSDIFAVGLVFYEMLTGARAFERDSSLKTLKAIVQEKPLNPRELNPDIPMEVVKVLSKALEKNPDRRYKSAQELQLAIEDYLESSPKKSNNVRLSRYMYDLFDDELNSADGTMVVKGIGEVIIPASQNGKFAPPIEDDVDHKTLSAALLPSDRPEKAANTKGAQPASSVPAKADKPAEKAGAAPAPARRPTSPPVTASEEPSDDDDDGKTLPAYDLEQLEQERVARQTGAQPPKQQPAPASAASLTGPGHTVPGRASRPSGVSPPSEVPTKAMAPRGLPSIEEPSGPRWEASTNQGRTNPEAPASRQLANTVPQASELSGPSRSASPAVAANDGLTSDTPTRAPRLKPERTASRTAPPVINRLPPLFYVAVAAIVGLFVLSAAGLVVIITTRKPIEYGLVLISTSPAQAKVMIDGEEVGESPTQATVPQGRSFTVTVSLNGYQAPAEQVVTLENSLLDLPQIKLQPKP